MANEVNDKLAVLIYQQLIIIEILLNFLLKGLE